MDLLQTAHTTTFRRSIKTSRITSPKVSILRRREKMNHLAKRSLMMAKTRKKMTQAKATTLRAQPSRRSRISLKRARQNERGKCLSSASSLTLSLKTIPKRRTKVLRRGKGMNLTPLIKVSGELKGFQPRKRMTSLEKVLVGVISQIMRSIPI